MSDTSIPHPGEHLDRLELMTLHLMIGGEQPIWSIEDLGRELDNPGGVQDAVHGLRTAGLAHQTSDGYVFASRAAVRMIELTGPVG